MYKLIRKSGVFLKSLMGLHRKDGNSGYGMPRAGVLAISAKSKQITAHAAFSDHQCLNYVAW